MSVASLGFKLSSAMPRSGGNTLVARQSIDFDLVDSTLDRTAVPEDKTYFNLDATIASVITAINADPLPPS